MLLCEGGYADNLSSFIAFFGDHATVLWHIQHIFSKRYEWFGS